MMGLPNKCLVIKWNKDRKKILGVLLNNKVKRGTENFKAARQRQQLPSKKSKRECFPLPAKAVVTEFKMRRNKGAKVTKMWFCKQ